MFNNWGDMKLNKTLIAIGVFTALSLIALSAYALMQFAKEKYSIVLKDSSLEVVDFSVENKQELVNDVSPNPQKKPLFW